VLGQHDAGLHDVQVVQNFRISVGQASRQEVRLLLVVAFEANTIAGPDYGLQQCGSVARRHHLSLCELTACVEPLVAESPFALPINHIVQLH
jgi:hypothetical protein